VNYIRGILIVIYPQDKSPGIFDNKMLRSSLRGYNFIEHPECIDYHIQIANRSYTQGGCLPVCKEHWRRKPLGARKKRRGRGQESVKINLPICNRVGGKKKKDKKRSKKPNYF